MSNLTYMSQNMLVVLFIVFVSCNCLSIGTVGVQNVTKREARTGDFYPDWVPFKNKQGEELGEFVQVGSKSKLKKRLAPPVNFVLRAVAEPEGEDYYLKGDSNGEDNYENKDWADLNRSANPVNHDSNHTILSDIDGVVSIITRPSPITEVLKRHQKHESEKSNQDNDDDTLLKKKKEKARNVNEKTHEEGEENEENNEKDVKEEKEQKEDNDEKEQSEEGNKERDKESSKEEKKQTRNEDENDYEETNQDKRKPDPVEEDQSENEARKARILDSVDELKERHAAEQRLLSERVKEEEIYKEQLERDKIVSSIKSEEESDRYGHRTIKPRIVQYDDYPDSESVEDKYKIKPLRIKHTTPRPTRRTTRRKPKTINRKKYVESGKLSVFKNPHAYMIYDVDEDSVERPIVTTSKPKSTYRRTEPSNNGRFSSRYTTPSTVNSDENVRISLVPEDNEGKDGEPTLFFPKKRKNKRRRKNKNTTVPIDSFVAESVPSSTAKDFMTPSYVTGTDNSITGIAGARTFKTITGPSSEGTAPSAGDTNSTADTTSTAGDITSTAGDVTSTAGDVTSTAGDTSSSDSAPSAASVPSAVDTVPASSDHKKEAKKEENYHNEKGGDREHHSEHEEMHEEHGRKAYEGIHKDTKTEKGHHDKEDHLGNYKDNGGHDHHHHDEKNHYGAHHHEEHGKKHAKYEESGKHSKGHSTKGSHDIHKKEEYEKKVEFFEEDGDSAEEEKHGGHNHEREHKAGGHFKKGNLKADYHGQSKGDTGHFEKGGHSAGHKAHKASAGHDSHGKHGGDHHSHGGQQHGKKWIYHHGHPAKTANLVVIDRRADRYQHGPQYFGGYGL